MSSLRLFSRRAMQQAGGDKHTLPRLNGKKIRLFLREVGTHWREHRAAIDVSRKPPPPLVPFSST
jgi:hypothetical protein